MQKEKKRMRGALNAFLSLVLAAGLLPVMPAAAAADEPAAADLGSVHVTVENTTFTAPVDNEAPAWTGKLVDTAVALAADSTMMSCVQAAITSAGKTYEMKTPTYMSGIEGLSEFDGGDKSGWMGSLNDWFTNEGFSAYSVANGKLSAGDEIRVMYSSAGLGADLGADWESTDRTLAAIAFSAGALDKEFGASERAYTLTVPEGTASVKVAPTAANKNYQVRTFSGGTQYKRAADVPVSDGVVITVKSGYKDLDAANDAADAVAYTFTVKVGTPAVPELVDSGTSGNAEWKFYSDGSLEISAAEGTDGAMPNYTATTVPWGSHKADIVSATVHEGVTTLGNFAFSEHSALKTVSLPGTLTKFGNFAFNKTSQLESVVIPESVKTYGSFAFGSSGIKNITVGGKIGLQMFKDCRRLETAVIREGVAELPGNMFLNCTSLREVALPSTLAKINATSFKGCKNLSSFTCAEGCPFSFDNGILYKGTEIAYVCPSAITGTLVIPEGIETLSATFQGCTGITDIQFPASLKTIAANAFMGCTGIESLHIPGTVKVIGNGAFQRCTSLKTLVMDDLADTEGVSYGYGIFNECASLNSVRLPQNMPAYNDMFVRCPSLSELVLPDAMGDIYYQAGPSVYSFSICGMTRLDKLVLPRSVEKFPLDENHKVDSDMNQRVTYVSFPGAKEVTQLVPGDVRILMLPATLEKYDVSDQRAEVILFGGTEEQWNAAATDNAKSAIEKNGTKVFFNADGTGAGASATITKQPESKSIFQGIGDPTLSVEAQAPEGAIMQYQWHKVSGGVDTRMTAEMSPTISVDMSALGSTGYYCVVRTVHDGAVSEVKTDVATVEVKEYTPADAFEGDGSAENPWIVSSQADLSVLGSFVNSGISFEDQFIGLQADVELPADWKPMGCTKDGTNNIKGGKNLWPFSGTFLGNGHTVTVPAGGKPLIGYVKGAEVRDLNVYGERIDGYGLVDNLVGVGLSGSAVVIDNVTLKAGTNVVKSGLIGAEITTNGFAGCSAEFVTTVRNCTVERGVTVGCDGDQSMVGSIAGRFQGTVENCVSYATVKGTYFVGGIIGTRDNAMGQVEVRGCTFGGTVEASGRFAGGIVGGGYSNSTAPNGILPTIVGNSCTGTVTGKDGVGGILGGDGYVAQAWNAYEFRDNFFGGKVSGESNVGAIIGFKDSLNKMDGISGNTFAYGCGTDKGIGGVWIVDTSCANPTPADGTLYVNTEDGVDECPEVTGCAWKAAHNRTDDPLGADADALCKMIAPAFEVSTAVAADGSGVVPAAVKAGDTVTVDVSVSANYGAAALSGTLDYDPAVFELVGVARGAGLSEGASFMPAEGAAEALFSFYGNEAAADAEGGIVVATVTLKALAAADAATIGVKDATAAIAGDALDYAATVGSVATLDVLADATLGDANGNGRVNIVDAQVVYDMAAGAYGADYAALALPAGWTRATLLWAANVNGDDAIDAADAFAIQRFVHYGAWA